LKSSATHAVNVVAIDDGIVPEAGFRTVAVSIPKTLAGSAGRLFARLKVVVATP
jgi:hypothetical protein